MTVKIRHASAGPEPAYFNTRDFNLQVSVNGTTWTSVATIAGNTDAVTTHTFAPTAARYVRLNISTPTQNGDPAARIYEVEVYADTNLALNKPATGSTACSPSAGPEKAVNGAVTDWTSDKWCSTAASKWWQVDLGVAQTVASMRIKHAAAGPEPGSLNTRDFNIQVSVDATTWTPVATVEANSAPITTHNSGRERPATSGSTSPHQPRTATPQLASTRSRSTPAPSLERTGCPQWPTPHPVGGCR